jgi:hypothetical protein
MGYIKEPEGVDFVIHGKPLTDEQKMAISAFIKADKAKATRIKASKRSASKTNKASKEKA